MKKSSKKSKTLSIRYYIETERKNSIYRAVKGRCPEFKHSDDNGWTESDEYPTEDNLKKSRTVDGNNWAVKRASISQVRALIASTQLS